MLAAHYGSTLMHLSPGTQEYMLAENDGFTFIYLSSGTQGRMLAERYGFTHLSAGDLLRSEIAWETERGQRFLQLLRSKGEIGLFEGLEMVRVSVQCPREMVWVSVKVNVNISIFSAQNTYSHLT